jgi:hypothetical protein
MLVLGDLQGCLHDEGHVRIFGLVERRGHAHDHGVCLAQHRGLGRCVEQPGLDVRREIRGRHVANVGLALVQELDLARVVVEPRDTEALAGELRNQRQAHVADADDDHSGPFLGESL